MVLSGSQMLIPQPQKSQAISAQKTETSMVSCQSPAFSQALMASTEGESEALGLVADGF